MQDSEGGRQRVPRDGSKQLQAEQPHARRGRGVEEAPQAGEQAHADEARHHVSDSHVRVRTNRALAFLRLAPLVTRILLLFVLPLPSPAIHPSLTALLLTHARV